MRLAFVQIKLKEEKKKMKMLNGKTAAILVSTLLMLSMMTVLLPKTLGQVAETTGTVQTSYPYVVVGPNPIGVGQTATIVMFVAQPPYTAGLGAAGGSSQYVQNWTVVVTNPAGVQTVLGPFKSDATGGTDTTYVPAATGNYTFQGFVGQQTLSNGMIWSAGKSSVYTLVVQSAPVTLGYYPVTPLPTQWWQTPITAENVQNWYAISGPWLGYGDVAFAVCGGYNNTQNMYNPYTLPVLSGHILWTRPWAIGGVVGGSAGGTELSHFWSTDQYAPKYAPVIMNGIMYSTIFDTDENNPHGIAAWNLFTGQSVYTIDTTTVLIGGMETTFKNPNQYGTVGPYIITEGVLPADAQYIKPSGNPFAPFTAYNLWDAFNGAYVCSVVNCPAKGAPFGGVEMDVDTSGNVIGWYIDTSNITGDNSSFTNPMLNLFNMTKAIGMGNPYGAGPGLTFLWGPTQGGIFQFNAGIEWWAPVPTTVNGQALNTPLEFDGATGNEIVLTGGYTFGQFYGGLQQGYNYVCAMSETNGAVLWIKNFTYADTPSLEPWTRTQMQIFDGLWVQVNEDNRAVIAVDANSGTIAWQTTLPASTNSQAGAYDVFNIRTYNGQGCLVVVGFGGDIWCVNETNGHLIWQTNTIAILGNPGLETPYATWPLWVFVCDCISPQVGYFAVGHEYNPPLFHGAQLLAINMTNGNCIWHELDFSVESTSISYGVVLSRNAYDNQIYAFGKGPSQTTVTAPDIGITTDTPITITGTVMDVSPGTQQEAVKLDFPNGVPCVSDASESHYMEYVYQQQPEPANTTGVVVTLTETDVNHNTYVIGSTTTDASGTYGYVWTPPIPGNYTIVATFAGTNSYYGSCAETHIYASSPPPTAPPTASPPSGLASTSSLELGIAAVIIVIVIIGVAILVVLMRKRP